MKNSNLTPAQQKLVRTPAFKAWFGDWEFNPSEASKVVDENGEPLVVYHGTKYDFNIFNLGKIPKQDWDKIKGTKYRSGADPTAFMGSHFSKEIDVAKLFVTKKGKIIYCFLNIKNPYRTDELTLQDELKQQQLWDDIKEESNFYNDYEENNSYVSIEGKKDFKIAYFESAEFRQEVHHNILNKGKKESLKLAEQLGIKKRREYLERKKYDGVIYANEYEGGTSFISFNPTQIKLADGSNTTFDGSNPHRN